MVSARFAETIFFIVIQAFTAVFLSVFVIFENVRYAMISAWFFDVV